MSSSKNAFPVRSLLVEGDDVQKAFGSVHGVGKMSVNAIAHYHRGSFTGVTSIFPSEL